MKPHRHEILQQGEDNAELGEAEPAPGVMQNLACSCWDQLTTAEKQALHSELLAQWPEDDE